MNHRAGALGNLPESASGRGVVSVLSVLNRPEDRENLEAIFNHTNWRISGVSCCQEALERLAHSRVSVVVCDSRLSDGSWKKFLHRLDSLHHPPPLIVASDREDVSLWAEVLNLGAYDVLKKPFDKEEVIRIVSLAWLLWRGRWFSLNRQQTQFAKRNLRGAT